ncbi:MAG: alpha/beta fold hydrolase [Lachnospiraceae bacterium]
MVKEIYIPSTDQKNRLHVVIWEPEGEIKAIMQISHGMVEYVERFHGFACSLNQHGILVIGNDHLGHGKTASSDDDLGYFGAEKSKTVVDDIHSVTVYAKERYGEKPYFLFGHSMGSFMARRYLMTYGEELEGAIISGTGFTPSSVLNVAGFVAGWLKLIHGERYRSPFLKKLSFTGYLDRIENPRTENDWLTKDEAIVDKYNADKFCTYTFTVNGYQTLFGVLRYIQKPKNVEKIPKDIPIFMISGAEDPVGAYGEGVKKVYDSYKSAGIKDVSMRLYEGARHELTNEIGKENVYADVKEWIFKHAK